MATEHMQTGLDRYIRSVAWLRWLFLTKQDKIVIGQMPNVPLWVGLGADVLAYASKGQIHRIGNGISQAAFVIWALMEIFWGLNPFRRLLGGVVLALVGFAIFREVGQW